MQLARPVGPRDKLGIELSALYQNQVMDVSETETNLTRILVEGVGISLKPKWNHTFGPGWEMRLEAVGGPQLYAGEVDSYWEAGGKLSLLRTYGQKSELSINFQSLHWLYDDREQNDLQGEPVPGTSLAFWRPEVFASGGTTGMSKGAGPQPLKSAGSGIRTTAPATGIMTASR